MSRNFKSVLVALSGLAIPLLVALAATPFLLRLVGPVHYGVLAICWGLVGYAGVLDFGVARAVTQQIASRDFASGSSELAELIGTARRLSSLIGVALAVVGFLLWGVAAASLDFDLQFTVAAVLICLAFPAQSLFSLYRGVLEARQKFGTVAALRIAASILGVLGPLVVASVQNSLPLIILSVVLARWVVMAAASALVLRSCNLPAFAASFSKEKARGILIFGSWAMVSSLTGLVFTQVDRLYIGFQLGAAAVTSYTIPYDLVTQSTILVSALSTVLFPWLSGKFHQDQHAARRTLRRMLVLVGLYMGVVLAVLGVFAPELAQLWLADEASGISIDVWRLLCVGVYFNSLGVVLFAAAHARGQARNVALSHLVQLPFYVTALICFIDMYGVAGAAGAWAMRTFVDLVMLASISKSDLLGREKLLL